MKICVLGAGSLGCAIGGTLAKSGADVTLINHRQALVEAIASKGLTLRSGGVDTQVKVRAAQSAHGLGAMDLIIVLVKSFDTARAIQSAMPLVAENTVVLSLQNGLGHEEVLARSVGADRVMLGISYVGGFMLEPGVVVAGTAGKETLIGEPHCQGSPRGDAIATIFNQAGIATRVCADIRATVWDKLLVNVATGALSGITGLPYGLLYQMQQVQDCAVAAVTEAMDVAKAIGIQLSTTDPLQAWTKAGAGLPFDFKPSMLQSLEKGTITEVDCINGAIVALGETWGIPTPVNRTLVACIKGLERRLQKTKTSKDTL